MVTMCAASSTCSTGISICNAHCCSASSAAALSLTSRRLVRLSTDTLPFGLRSFSAAFAVPRRPHMKREALGRSAVHQAVDAPAPALNVPADRAAMPGYEHKNTALLVQNEPGAGNDRLQCLPPWDARQIKRERAADIGRYHQITVLLRNQCPEHLGHRNIIHHQRDRLWRGGPQRVAERQQQQHYP